MLLGSQDEKEYLRILKKYLSPQQWLVSPGRCCSTSLRCWDSITF